MGNFCRNCGRPLQEGEICNCTQQKNEQAIHQQQYQQQYQGYPAKKKGIPKLLVPLGQTIVGGMLFLVTLLSAIDWEVAFLVSAGFLLTGICGLVELNK